MNSLQKMCTVCLGLVALGLAGCNDTENVQKSQATLEVSAVRLMPRTISVDIEMEGRVRAYQTADVRPQVNGILQKRMFEEGDDVKEGQILYLIDPLVYEAELASAKASLERAEAQLMPAKLKMERHATLVGQNAVSKQDKDDANAVYKQALADVGVAKAVVESAKIRLDYTQVKAPISGRTGRSMITVGALMTANQADLLTTVTQLDPIFVDVTQSSRVMLDLEQKLNSGTLQSAKAQAPVRLKLENGTAYDKEGTLTFTGTKVDENTGSLTLRAIFPNSENKLLPGMYVRAVLTAGTDTNAILVPQEAVMRDPKGNAYVYVVNGKGEVESRQLELGRTVMEGWVVFSGLEAGDLVIIDGLQIVRPGMKPKVKVQSASEKPVSTLRTVPVSGSTGNSGKGA